VSLCQSDDGQIDFRTTRGDNRDAHSRVKRARDEKGGQNAAIPPLGAAKTP